MKRLAILAFSLGVMVAPFQAHAQKPVEFNGMVFDTPPVPGYEAPKTQAPTKARTTTHQQHHHHRAHAAITIRPAVAAVGLYPCDGRARRGHPRLRFDAR